MFYEWRTYRPMPGKGPALHRHLEVAKGYFDTHGLPTLGFWTDEIGAAGGQISYVWVFKDFAEREKGRAALGADPGWRAHLKEEAATEGAIVAGVTNTLMEPTAYFPEAKMAGKVQELRIYDAPPGKLPALLRRFGDHTVGLFEKHGLANVGHWTETVGTSNRLVYMLGFDSVAARETSWAAFGKDPDWQAARAASEKDGPLVASVSNRLLRPTRFSPR